ncbi:MAG: SDR family oxidoreductase [Pirellulales bacterium]
MTVCSSLFDTPHPVALVTGSGAKRVGRVIAETLAARGYRVVTHANRSQADAQELAEQFNATGAGGHWIVGDLAQEAVARRIVQEAYRRWQRLDVVVNAAAIWERIPLESTTAEDVLRHFQVNTLSTFIVSQEAGALMVAQPTGGVIVQIGDWAVERPYRDYAAYFPSKGAIPTLTRTLAVELAARNPRIRVNAVLPGPVMLPPDLPAAERDAAIAGTLVQREGSPQNVADAVVALAENDFITGVCLPVDGGRRLA